MRIVSLGSAVLFLWPVVGQAGGGAVALQTAAPSCRDGSTNIYVNCGNGTVTDNRTGLVWLANANCEGVTRSWYAAMEFAASLSDLDSAFCSASGLTPAACDCGLSDGSSPGEWRLPSADEWRDMIADALGVGGDPNCVASPPTITNDSGGGCWSGGGSSFTNVQAANYWGSTPVILASPLVYAYGVLLTAGFVGTAEKVNEYYVWPVRGGQ